MAGAELPFRLLGLLSVALNIAISATFRLRARRATGTIARRAEPTPLLVGRALFGAVLFGTILGWIAHPPLFAWAAVELPSIVRWAGVALALGSTPLLAAVLRAIGANISETVLTKEHHQLVVDGPYRWVRHPLYAGAALWLAGLTLLSANAFLGVWSAMSVALVRWVVVPREEAALVAAFGDAYRRYAERTGAMLPRWKRIDQR